jgi:hypothetical protein
MRTYVSGGVLRTVLTPGELAARRKLFSRFKTQEEVDAEIARLIALETKAEERRDRCEFESPAYWEHHDVAVKHRLKAVALMPPGSG